MRLLICVAVVSLATSRAAQNQPYGYYPGPGAAYAYRYEPPRGYGAGGSYLRGFRYADGYDGYHHDDGAPGLAVMDMPGWVAGHPAWDRYGPDPNGAIAPDGHRWKCKIVDGYGPYGRDGRYRKCW